jgi:hypothetical protein
MSKDSITLKKLAEALTEEGHFLTGIIGNKMRLNKTVNGRPVSVFITRINGKLSLEFPKYIFNSMCADYEPSDTELRYCRNKVLLFHLVRTLKRSRVWNYIDNKNFIKVNTHKKKSDKKSLEKRLHQILD